MISSRPVALRRVGPAVAAAALLPALLSGCEVEAVELVRDIEAARGECTREGLRESDEECVRMMERYTSMGTDLVHTYLGGLKALDMALDRMPPPDFDTAGVGYAISPELRQGDPAGIGGSPRLVPARSAYDYGYDPAAAGYESPAWRSDARLPRGGTAPATRRSTDGYFGGAYDGYGDRPAGRAEYSDRYARSRYDDAEYDRWRDRHRRGIDRAGRYGRDGYYAEPYGSFGSYPPFGLGGFSPFPLGPSAPLGDWRYSPFGFGSPYGPGGYGPYGYEGYGVRGGYAPAVGWSGGAYDSYGRYPGYDPYDPYAAPYVEDRYGRYAPPPRAGGYDDLPPADAWGYDATVMDGVGTSSGDPRMAEPASAADDPPAERSVAPARPAPHRPGILLPPEERLRRPWLND
jgi:hypothetical protein